MKKTLASLALALALLALAERVRNMTKEERA